MEAKATELGEQVAMRWAYLERIKITLKPRIAKGPEGFYPTGEFDSAEWLLRCKCGTEFMILEDDFPGRRFLRSCEDGVPGRKGKCSAVAARAKKPVNEPKERTELKMVVQVYMTHSLAAQIDAYALGNDLTMSKAASELIKKGLERI